MQLERNASYVFLDCNNVILSTVIFRMKIDFVEKQNSLWKLTKVSFLRARL